MQQVAGLVRDATGLTFPAARVADVEAAIRRAMQRHDIARPGGIATLLNSDDAAREELVADLTIGETYFQRDPAQFDLLRTRILPELLRSRSADRPVRVWSAGCASGEEPYTVAMLFDELNALDRCAITGTDIARRRLEDAQRGVYSRWSLRNTPDAIRQRYFRERGRYYELMPRLREHVNFRYLNLAEDRFPSLSVGIWGMDVILCRNVLIYFDQETVRQVAERLIATLSEDGWLIMGASDPALGDLVDCDVVLTDSGVVYRRPGAAGDEAAQRFSRPSSLPPAPADHGAYDAGADTPPATGTPDAAGLDEAAVERLFGRLKESLDAAGPAGPGSASMDPAGAGSRSAGSRNAGTAGARPPGAEGRDGRHQQMADAYARQDFDDVVAMAEVSDASDLSCEEWVLWIRALANTGSLGDAGHVAARALEAIGPVAELLYLHGVLLVQAGRPADAAAALRRALYLDRQFVVAHLTLADAQQSVGNTEGARRSLRNAAALLEAMPVEDTVRGSDGEKAGRLKELVRVKLQLLTDAA